MVTIEVLVHEMNVAAERAALSRVMGEYDAADYWDQRVEEINAANVRRERADAERGQVHEIGVS